MRSKTDSFLTPHLMKKRDFLKYYTRRHQPAPFSSRFVEWVEGSGVFGRGSNVTLSRAARKFSEISIQVFLFWYLESNLSLFVLQAVHLRHSVPTATFWPEMRFSAQIWILRPHPRFEPTRRHLQSLVRISYSGYSLISKHQLPT